MPLADIEFTDEEAPYAPAGWRQLVLIVADGSVSMTWQLQEPDESLPGAPARTKAEGVDGAVRELINRLQASRKASNFDFAWVTFTDKLTDQRDPVELIKATGSDNYDPTANGTGGTRVHTGLEAARKIIEAFYALHGDDLPISVVVLVLSDGEDSAPDAALAAAKELKALPAVFVAACLFATKDEPAAGAPLLQAIVSQPRLFQTVWTAEQLRKFFHDSVTMVALSAYGADGAVD